MTKPKFENLPEGMHTELLLTERESHNLATAYLFSLPQSDDADRRNRALGRLERMRLQETAKYIETLRKLASGDEATAKHLLRK